MGWSVKEGTSDTRQEDTRFLTGQGRYTADLLLPAQLHACLARSPHAQAGIERIETAAARAVPGVVAVFTAADLEQDGLGPIRCQAAVRQSDGSESVLPARPILARARVRFVGEAVALVVAETPEAAATGADRLDVRYRPMPAAVALDAAIQADAPQLWPEAPGNLCCDWHLGDAAAVERAFARARHVVTLDLINNRVSANPLEGRVAVGAFDPATGQMTLTVSSQGVHHLRAQLAHDIFRVPEDAVRVVTPDVGGGFGMKFYLYPEYALVLFAARRLERPVRWVATRGEGLLSDSHGRDHKTRAALALDAAGTFLALRVDTLANLGAYPSDHGPFIATEGGTAMLAGVYRTPAIHARVRCVFTNTAPVDAYRGAGRPEAIYCLERLIDFAAQRLGFDRVELRRRNMIPPTALPRRTPLGLTYDAGDFPRALDLALQRADVAGFPDRRRRSAAAGRLRGLGLACYVEACAGGPGERTMVTLARDGRITVAVGTQSSGQGHETVFARLVADRLGVAAQDVTLIQGDSARIASGAGTAASRSMAVGATVLRQAVDRLIETMRTRAAAQLEVPVDDLDIADGQVRVRDSNRGLSLAALAAAEPGPEDTPACTASAAWTPAADAFTFPYGAHVCEVEVDPETGAAAVVRYCAVDDFGRILDETLTRGQVQGGVAQGIGQALLEQIRYDPATGAALTSDLRSYALPRAQDLPPIAVHFLETPTTHNPLSVKGAGEAGAIAAPPTVINALVDALAPFGIDHIDMPATPEAIWQHLQQARRKAG